MSVDLEFLRSLCLAPGPSGFEAPAQELVRSRAAAVATVHDDALGNVWAETGPEGGPHVVVAAHIDQIGMIVTYVDEHGFVSFGKIGGIDDSIFAGRHIVIHSADGLVHGVVGKAPQHILTDAEKGKAPPVTEQFIDIGAPDRETALARISVGDPITFTPDFVELSPGIVAGQAMDDRAGVYITVRALELYAAMQGKARFTAVATVHEETTFMGARAQAYRMQPDCTIVIDGDFDSGNPYVDPKKVAGEVKLGAGPVLGRGAGSNEALLRLARDVARAEDIPVQIKAYPTGTSTDAEELMASGVGATLSLSFPTRYMHSPFEVVATADLEAAAHLVAALIARVGETFEPGCFVPRA